MPRRVVVSSSSSSRVAVKPASIGAVVGCDRVFCGVVRDAVGLKKFFDRAIRSTHPVENVDFLDGMCGSDCSIEKIAIEKALFRLRKNTRSGLRSEIALFDPPIRLHRNWPNEHTGTLNHENSRNSWPGNRWPARSSSPVCSRAVQVCQHRSALYPLGVPIDAIKQCHLAAIKVNSSAKED